MDKIFSVVPGAVQAYIDHLDFVTGPGDPRLYDDETNPAEFVSIRYAPNTNKWFVFLGSAWVERRVWTYLYSHDVKRFLLNPNMIHYGIRKDTAGWYELWAEDLPSD